MKYTVDVNETRTRWYKEGTKILHREDGPAVEWDNGSKEWWVNGVLHREDGPAIEYANGSKEWWTHGERLTEEEFIAWQNKPKNLITINGKTKEIPQESLDMLKDLL